MKPINYASHRAPSIKAMKRMLMERGVNPTQARHMALEMMRRRKQNDYLRTLERRIEALEAHTRV